MEKPNKTNKNFRYRCLTLLLAMILLTPYMYCNVCLAANSDNDLNFKIYNPETPAQSDTPQPEESSPDSASIDSKTNDSKSNSNNDSVDLRPEMPVSASTPIAPKLEANPSSSNPDTLSKEVPTASTSAASVDTGSGEANTLQKELPLSDSNTAAPSTQPTSSSEQNSDKHLNQADNKTDETAPSTSSDQNSVNTDTAGGANPATGDAANQSAGNKVLQGYVRVVPSGTKIPIIMDTAVDSDTSQEGDEFSARTSEDLTIDGNTVVPAGSIIKGRIATLNAPRHMIRSGSVALKFDTVTTPDNRQIPLVANLVARGGVVHAKRGLKDVAIDAGVFSLPTAIGLGIGVIAGHSSGSSIGPGGAALIGAGVGAAVGLAVLLAKKGKKVDVRPGDELRIELAEDLHMPTM